MLQFSRISIPWSIETWDDYLTFTSYAQERQTVKFQRWDKTRNQQTWDDHPNEQIVAVQTQEESVIGTGFKLYQADILWYRVPVFFKLESAVSKVPRNSHFMKAVWEAQKEALRSHCEDVSPDNHVCCPNDSKKRSALGTWMAPESRAAGLLRQFFFWDDIGRQI